MNWLKQTLTLLILLGSQQIFAQTAPISVVFDLIDDGSNRSHFIAELTLTNDSAQPLRDWRLHLNFMRNIVEISDARVEKMIGDYYIIKPERALGVGQSQTFTVKGDGFIQHETDAPSAYFVTLEGQEPLHVDSTVLVLPNWKPSGNNDVFLSNAQNNQAQIEGNPADPEEMRLNLENTLLVPIPVKLKNNDKSDPFILSTQVQVLALDPRAQPVAAKIKEWLSTLPAQNIRDPQAIELIASEAALPAEGYKLKVSKDKVTIEASDEAGFYYAFKSLEQLGYTGSLPQVSVEDWPRFEVRALHLDAARHFFSVEDIKRLLDLMAGLKLNYFHWHLTDDEGFRLEVNTYPELVNVGAQRGYGQVLPPHYTPGAEVYRGYYTQEEARDVVAYAAERNIIVVPEIDLPGHARALIYSLPDLLIDPQDRSKYLSIQRFNDNVLTPCLESTFVVLDNIFAEMVEIFTTSQYLHVGGDEVPNGVWANNPVISPNCHALYEARGISTREEMQNYFFMRVNELVKKHGKKMAGFEEVIQGGGFGDDNKNIMIYPWFDPETANEAASQNYPVVLFFSTAFYFDLAYSADPKEPGQNWAGYISAFTAYATDPFLNIDTEFHHNIKGVQGALWSEKITSQALLDYFTFPRLAALAEIGWSDKQRRNWVNFSERMGAYYLPYLDSKFVQYRLPIPGVNQTALSHGILEINTEFPGVVVRYETSGKEPTLDSPRYDRPVKIGAQAVSVRSFDSQGRGGRAVQYGGGD